MNFLDIEVDLDPKKSRRPSNFSKNQKQPPFIQLPSIGGQHALEQDFDDIEIPGQTEQYDSDNDQNFS